MHDAIHFSDQESVQSSDSAFTFLLINDDSSSITSERVSSPKLSICRQPHRHALHVGLSSDEVYLIPNHLA
jgi:hypothetical protein